MEALPALFSIILGAAAVDSINPSAFGVLIFLLSYILETSGEKTKMILHGGAFIAGIFVAYLSAGIFLLPVIGSLGQISKAVYVGLSIAIVLSGITEIKDFLWRDSRPSLTLIPGSGERIKIYSRKISGSLWAAFGLGVFVALVELPFSGAPYLALLSIMSISGVSPLNALLLTLYNLVFVSPLLIILLMFIYGLKSQKVDAWRKAHRTYMRLLIGLVLVGLGGWMLYYTV